jgi:hypothetical protein
VEATPRPKFTARRGLPVWSPKLLRMLFPLLLMMATWHEGMEIVFRSI